MTEPSDLADWRRRTSDLYHDVRQAFDPQAGWAAWRSERDAMFAQHPSSPWHGKRDASGGIPIFPYDPAWRLADRLLALDGDAFTVEAGRDGAIRMRPVAVTTSLTQRLGRELTLYWIEGYGGGLFLPFKDATSGRSTYGGGRYLIDSIKGADLGRDAEGRTILDFNFAYHPSCAHSPEWVCPLAPPENVLEVAIEAGERLG